jgi:hypothetical protein
VAGHLLRSLLLASALLALGASAAGCGKSARGQSTTTTAGGTTTADSSQGTTTTGQTTTGATEEEGRPYETWFTQNGRLDLVWTRGEVTIGVLTQALVLLLDGPGSDGETAIPAGTELRNLVLSPKGTATIDLTSTFLSGPASTQALAKAQIVYTATQFPTVRAVRLFVGGNPIAAPQRRKTYEDLLPPIVVERPSGLEPVTSPLRVAGSANVFEANVTIRLLDANGEEILSTFTTATCGTGCRGTFATRVGFDASKYDEITLVVHDDDADGDGKPGYEVRIPLTVKG